MTLDDIVRQAFDQLQESYDFPNFWQWNQDSSEPSEVKRYAYEGLREILKQTKLNITECMIPLYTHLEMVLDDDGNPETDPDTGDYIYEQENFLGIYNPPISKITTISEIYWRGTTERDMIPLTVISKKELDRKNPAWRTETTATNPTHAVLYSGNYNELKMGKPNLQRNGIKIKLYPTPTNIDIELQNLLAEIAALETELNATRLSQYGGLMNSGGGGMAWGLDTNDDGVRDDIPLESSSLLGILIDIQAGAVDLSDYSNYPIIGYTPEITEGIFNETIEDSGRIYSDWYDLSNLIPEDMQIALREYICYRCFRKEGEAIDLKKSAMYKELFDELIDEYKAINYLFQYETKTSDANFDFGYDHNNAWRR